MAVINVDDAEFDSVVIDSKKTVIVDVSTDWCPSCKVLAPVFEKLSDELDDVVFASVNASKNPEIPSLFGISYVPTLMLFKNGELVKKEVGAKSPVELEQFILG